MPSLLRDCIESSCSGTVWQGLEVPDGIANSATTADFFQSLVVGHQLHSMYGFKNERFLFVDVEHTVTFALLTIGGSARPAKGMEFCWLTWTVEEMLDPARRVVLTADDILLINPNTKTCPTFRTQRDAELIKSIYRRVPVLRREGPPEENSMGPPIHDHLSHVVNDSDVFRTREQLDGEGWAFDGRTYTQRGDSYVRLYEGRLGHQFNHRFASESGGEVTESSNTQLQDPGYLDFHAVLCSFPRGTGAPITPSGSLLQCSSWISQNSSRHRHPHVDLNVPSLRGRLLRLILVFGANCGGPNTPQCNI